MTGDDHSWPPTTISTPEGALAWSADPSYVYTAEGLAEIQREGVVVLHVEEHPGDLGGMITNIAGAAPLAGLVRLDTDVALLSRRVAAVLAEVDDLRTRMLNAVEAWSSARRILAGQRGLCVRTSTAARGPYCKIRARATMAPRFASREGSSSTARRFVSPQPCW